MRVRSKAKPELAGTVVEDDPGSEDVWVQWDDYEHPGQRWRISRDRIEEIPDEPRAPELVWLDQIDHLRDSFNLAIELLIRSIQREINKEQKR
jgi:hypothetical protein